MKVLVTGVTGFVGRALCRDLLRRNHAVRGALRQEMGRQALEADVEPVIAGPIDASSDWHAALASGSSPNVDGMHVEVVVHLAARVHVMRDYQGDPLAEFRAVNTDGTLNLARQAAEAGIRRFVYVSSVKVNGEQTFLFDSSLHSREERRCFREDDKPDPQDAYAVSKWNAEQGLMMIARETGMEVVILRPPLVYGPGVKANFLRLLQWIDKGVPLPLASVDNRRSMIYLGNLVDALVACVEHPDAAGNTYLVSDGEDVSTLGLIHEIAAAIGKPAFLWNCPERVLRLAAKAVGKSAEADRLLGSLQVDSSKIRRELGWAPPFSFKQGIRETVEWYMKSKSQ